MQTSLIDDDDWASVLEILGPLIGVVGYMYGAVTWENGKASHGLGFTVSQEATTMYGQLEAKKKEGGYNVEKSLLHEVLSHRKTSAATMGAAYARATSCISSHDELWA